MDNAEFDFELRRYLLSRNATVITREQLEHLQGFENLASCRSDRDALAAEVKSLRAQLELEAVDALAAEQNWADRLVAARAEVESLRAAVARVRELHRESRDGGTCGECIDEWPCRTKLALDEDPS